MRTCPAGLICMLEKWLRCSGCVRVCVWRNRVIACQAKALAGCRAWESFDNSGVGSRGLGDVWNVGTEDADDGSQQHCC